MPFKRSTSGRFAIFAANDYPTSPNDDAGKMGRYSAFKRYNT
jgi:hypothetical protein